jgi:hypothetical protein
MPIIEYYTHWNMGKNYLMLTPYQGEVIIYNYAENIEK